MFGLISKVAASGMGAAAMAMLNDTAVAQTSLGNSQATAHETSTAYVEYTTVGANTGAILDNGNVGDGQVIWNNSATTLKVYPTVGGTINSGAINAAYSVGAGGVGLFKRLTASKWVAGLLFDSGTVFSSITANTITTNTLTVSSLTARRVVLTEEGTSELVTNSTFSYFADGTANILVISGSSGAFTGITAVNTHATSPALISLEANAGNAYNLYKNDNAASGGWGIGVRGTNGNLVFAEANEVSISASILEISWVSPANYLITTQSQLVANDEVSFGTSTLSTTTGGLVPPLQIQGTGAASGGVIIGNWGNNASIPHLFLTKSRGGSVGSQGAVLLGDTLGRVNVEASTGSALVVAGQIRWVATENWSGSVQGSGVELTGTSIGQTAVVRALVLGGTDVDGPFVGIGTPYNLTTPVVPSAMLHVASSASGASAARSEIRIQRGSADTTASIFSVYKNRGNSISAPAAINAGDDIAQFSFFGYVGGTGLNVEGARIFVDEIGAIANNSTGLGMLMEFHTRAVGGALTKQYTITDTGTLVGFNPTGGIGYTTGAGGTVTQPTNKSTGVTLNKVTGEITMNAAALAADTTVSFVLTNSAVAAGDYLSVQHVSAGTVGSYKCEAVCAGGTATITVRNITTGSLSEAIVLKFMLFKSATA